MPVSNEAPLSDNSTDAASSNDERPGTSPVLETLPVLPLPDGVVLPEMVVTITAQSPEAQQAVAAAVNDRLLLVPFTSKGDAPPSYARFGVVARIEDRGSLPDGTPALTVRALHRARVGTGVIGASAGLWVEAENLIDPQATPEQETLAVEYRAAATNLLDQIGGRRMSGALREIDNPGALADTIGYWPELTLERRVRLLEAADVTERLELAITWVKEALAEIGMRDRIQQEVTEGLEKNQREAILRRQMQAIQSELGEGDGDVVESYRVKLAALLESEQLDTRVAESVEREINRLERAGNDSMESNWIRTWLDTVFEIPWSERSDEQLGLDTAREILDADHTGLDDVKDRLVEYLAVRKLRADRASDEASGADTEGGNKSRRGGVILALVGPPGVGKTSLGESVARALGRNFVRLALGGIRDESEIRGHRRTYVGARPGRLVRALTEAGTMNPVILLDEVDKLGNSWQGDPSAALLEVLDPAQNHSFRDHYLEFELDLSDVVFIATANVLDTIPGPLLDRMEIITLDGYTEREKAAIAKDHLLPRLIKRNGLHPDEVQISDEAIASIAGNYTREAGVRGLERLLDKAVRKSATKIAIDQTQAPVLVDADDLREVLGRPIPTEDVSDRIDRPGIATGLAVTGAGGDVLFVETALVDGEGEPLLTGQLGDVMKESASLARSLVGAHGPSFGVVMPEGKRLHVHFPAGAIPKDGPSAGVTMTTALVSLLSGRAVKGNLAMTGEVTLQGRVLPIGGVKQKVLAAHRAGLTEVILPHANGPDLEDVPSDVLDNITVHLAKEISEVLNWALEPATA